MSADLRRHTTDSNLRPALGRRARREGGQDVHHGRTAVCRARRVSPPTPPLSERRSALSILETAFVVDVIDEDEGALEKVTEMEQADVVPKVPAMTLLELYIGVGLVARSQSKEQRVKRVIGSLPFVELTDAMAMKAGRITGELKNARTGR